MKDRLAEVVDEVVITGQNTDEKMCSCESDVVGETCSSESYDACGDGVLAIAQSTSLSGFVCFPRVCARIVLWKAVEMIGENEESIIVIEKILP